MKRQAISLISLLSLLLVAGSAIAQSGPVRSNVPFDFTVEGKTVPGGTYTIGHLNRSPENLLLRSEDGKVQMIVGSNAAQNLNGANKSKLIFNRYKDQYFLSEIWVQGSTSGRRIPKTKREKELAKEMASASINSERVEIVAALH
jgi:hypothetical protein